MPMYEYECAVHGKFETLNSISNRETAQACPVCGELSRYCISTPTIKLEGITGDFPTAYDRWEKKHRQYAAQHYE